MGVLGRLAGAVVRRGASLLRREAADVAKKSVRRIPVEGTAGIRRREISSLARGAEGPMRGGFKSTGRRYDPGPIVEGETSSLLGGESSIRASSFGVGDKSITGKFKPKADAPTVVTKKTTRGPEALRRASVVTRRYFTQGAAGRGLNRKGMAAALSAAVPAGLGLGGAVIAVKNKLDANAQASQPKQQTQTYQQGANKLAAQSSSTATGAVPSSTESSASTDTSPMTRSNSTTGVGGLLQGEMRASAAAVRPDRDYMGEAFDATLRKGVTSGRAYLKSQLARDKADVNKTKTTLAAYDKRVGSDTLLGRDRGVGYLKNADSDQTQKDLLSAYRGRFGAYRKNARASEIEAMAQAAAAKRGS